jgi:hypothetical protein
VIGAHDLIVDEGPHRQRHGTVRAAIFERGDLAGRLTKQHQPPIEHLSG